MIRLADILPDFAAELGVGLREDGRSDLADQLPLLEVAARCPCHDDCCATFFTQVPALWIDGNEGVKRVIPAVRGLTAIQVVDGRLAWFEVLNRPDVRARLTGLVPLAEETR